MASEGIKFTDYHSNGAVCSPTRTALMTGNYQQRAGLEGVIYAAPDKRMYGVSDEQKTMGEYFKDAGYTTGAFGKWHLGYKPEFNPTLHGCAVYWITGLKNITILYLKIQLLISLIDGLEKD